MAAEDSLLRAQAEARAVLGALREADAELRAAHARRRAAEAEAAAAEAGGGRFVSNGLGRPRDLSREASELQSELVQAKLRAAQLQMERDEHMLSIRKLQATNRILRGSSALNALASPTSPAASPGTSPNGAAENMFDRRSAGLAIQPPSA